MRENSEQEFYMKLTMHHWYGIVDEGMPISNCLHVLCVSSCALDIYVLTPISNLKNK